MPQKNEMIKEDIHARLARIEGDIKVLYASLPERPKQKEYECSDCGKPRGIDGDDVCRCGAPPSHWQVRKPSPADALRATKTYNTNELEYAPFGTMAEIANLRAEAEQLRQAIGLMATAKPSMVMRVDDPIGMAHEIVAEVEKWKAANRAAERSAADIDRHRCTLISEMKRLTQERDSILLEARCWAMEAKTQRRTVNEVGSALGGMADWGPIVEAVRSIIAERDEAVARENGLREALEALRTHPVVDGITCRIRDHSDQAGTTNPIALADATLARDAERGTAYGYRKDAEGWMKRAKGLRAKLAEALQAEDTLSHIWAAVKDDPEALMVTLDQPFSESYPRNVYGAITAIIGNLRRKLDRLTCERDEAVAAEIDTTKTLDECREEFATVERERDEIEATLNALLGRLRRPTPDGMGWLDPVKSAKEIVKALAAAKFRAEALREALVTYGRHNTACDVITEGATAPCDCGLDAALTQYGGES